jgi:hypothetical protein
LAPLGRRTIMRTFVLIPILALTAGCRRRI